MNGRSGIGRACRAIAILCVGFTAATVSCSMDRVAQLVDALDSAVNHDNNSDQTFGDWLVDEWNDIADDW